MYFGGQCDGGIKVHGAVVARYTASKWAFFSGILRVLLKKKKKIIIRFG